MGSTTPIYGWPYPYDADVINVATIGTLATDMDSTIFADVDQAETAFLQRPGAALNPGSGFSMTNGVVTQATFDLAPEWTKGGLTTGSSGITATPGLWRCTAQVGANYAGTCTSLRATLTLAGGSRWHHKAYPGVGLGVNELTVSGVIPVSSSGIIGVSVLFTGTSTGFASALLQIVQIG